MDRALYGTSEIVCIGAVYRNSNGQWLGGHLKNIGVCYVLQVELWGTLHGLALVWNLGSHHVIREINSPIAIQVLNKVLNNEVISVNTNSSLILAINI